MHATIKRTDVPVIVEAIDNIGHVARLKDCCRVCESDAIKLRLSETGVDHALRRPTPARQHTR